MDGAVTTDKYQCAECGGKDCAHVNVSGRRDVGKGETWGSSDAADETKDSQADDGRVLVR